jgi:hypothetical protein
MKCDKKIYSLDYNKTMFAVLVILLHFTFNEVLSIILQKVFFKSNYTTIDKHLSFEKKV